MHSYVDRPFRPSGVRVVCLDVETTGLDPYNGDRIVEIGAVEYLDGQRTGRVLHEYINPQRSVPAEAVKIHGLDGKFLSDKPVFASVATKLRVFVENAIVVIQNAPFDIGFISMEMAYCGLGELPIAAVIDTLETSKREGVSKRHTLDALCDRFGVNRTHRERHGALLDAELLGEVFVAMTRGRGALDIVSRTPIYALLDGTATTKSLEVARIPATIAASLRHVPASQAEISEHESYLALLRKSAGGACVWDATAH